MAPGHIRLIISHAAPLPDSETFIPEFGLNYSQSYIDFPSKHVEFRSNIYEQTSLLDPLSEREGSDTDLDNWQLPAPIDVGPLPGPENNGSNDNDQLPKRRGRKTNTTFTHLRHGELGHPWIDWRLDKASMEEYMPKYAKQEGYAVDRIKEKKGTVHRWKCHHAGKYNPWRKQPELVTDKKVLQENVDAGNLLSSLANGRRNSSITSWEILQAWVSFLYCIHCYQRSAWMVSLQWHQCRTFMHARYLYCGPVLPVQDARSRNPRRCDHYDAERD
jgi:hypothetical protein